MTIILQKVLSGSVQNPGPGSSAVFVDIADGILKAKNNDSSITSLGGLSVQDDPTLVTTLVVSGNVSVVPTTDGRSEISIFGPDVFSGSYVGVIQDCDSFRFYGTSIDSVVSDGGGAVSIFSNRGLLQSTSSITPATDVSNSSGIFQTFLSLPITASSVQHFYTVWANINCGVSSLGTGGTPTPDHTVQIALYVDGSEYGQYLYGYTDFGGFFRGNLEARIPVTSITGSLFELRWKNPDVDGKFVRIQGASGPEYEWANLLVEEVAL